MRHYTKLDKIYNHESNADIKERIQLVRRTQDKQHIENVAKNYTDVEHGLTNEYKDTTKMD
ncbi:MAG: hypothetical protein MRJ93_03315 [Nitrososphaeraceae archaeon]|nr:hypothetical protein [Nitrososphaeraceae archaeon]